MDPIMLIGLITAIIEAIAKCREEREPDQIVAGLRDPGWREWLIARRAVREETRFRGRKLRSATDEALAELRGATRQEIAAIMEEAEAVYEDRTGEVDPT